MGEAATRLLLLEVLLMVGGNCGGGLPVGVWGDSGDVVDGDGLLLVLVVIAAEELLLLMPLLVVGVPSIEFTDVEGGVAVNGDCWLGITPDVAATAAARSRSLSRWGRNASRSASTRFSLGPQRA